MKNLVYAAPFSVADMYGSGECIDGVDPECRWGRSRVLVLSAPLSRCREAVSTSRISTDRGQG